MKKHYHHEGKPNTHWIELRKRMVDYGIMNYGQMRKLANFLECHPSYLHRWLCPVCEHGNVPTYYMGKEIERYLATVPYEEVPNTRPKTGGRKCAICTCHTTEYDCTSGRVKLPNGTFKKVYVHQTCLVVFGQLQ